MKKKLTLEEIDKILNKTKYLNQDQEKLFWSKVNIKEPDDCWNWQGNLCKAGYGRFYLRDNREYAHRVSYISTYEMQNRLNCVCHKCDNPKCVNPNHLFEGTIQDNNNDMIRKGRGNQGNRKLNSEAVKVIRWMLKYRPKRGLASKLARLHKCAHQTISDIKRNKKWRDINV